MEKAGEHRIPLGIETVPLEKSLGRFLAEDIFSDRDVPPFPRATMDGYACRQQDLPGPLEVIETIPAGKMPVLKIGPGQCSRIMTGAMVPGGADCVIMQEYAKTGDNSRVFFTTAETDENIHPMGKDLREGELMVQQGTRLTPVHLGIIASTGAIRAKVSRILKIGIMATGDELVEAEQRPVGAQIRNSNSHQLAGQVLSAVHQPLYLGIVEDQRGKLAVAIKGAMELVNLLILTGGASVGETDLVPGVLHELGFQLEFNQVAIQPGKPVSFAHRNGKACFGLSGNPVSSFVQFELLVRPYLELCSGAIPVNRRLLMSLEKGFHRKHADRKFFLPVSFSDEGRCEPVNYHGSGHLLALDKTMGFAEIPAGQKAINKGELVHVRLI